MFTSLGYRCAVFLVWEAENKKIKRSVCVHHYPTQQNQSTAVPHSAILVRMVHTALPSDEDGEVLRAVVSSIARVLLISTFSSLAFVFCETLSLAFVFADCRLEYMLNEQVFLLEVLSDELKLSLTS